MSFRTCPDGHRCENGSTCKQDANNEGSYYCDCTTATSPFVGLYCEFPADVFCSFPRETSKTWHCANGGSCVLDSNNGQNVERCDCPSEYEGNYCEYVSGSVPENWPVGVSAPQRTRSGNGKGDGLETGVTAAIVIIVLALISLTAYVILRNRRSGADESFDKTGTPNSQKTDPSHALNIETDGAAFRDIVRSMSSPSGNDLDFETAHAGSDELDMEHASPTAYEDNDTDSVGGRII